jgi:hypothetical protein
MLERPFIAFLLWLSVNKCEYGAAQVFLRIVCKSCGDLQVRDVGRFNQLLFKYKPCIPKSVEPLGHLQTIEILHSVLEEILPSPI